MLDFRQMTERPAGCDVMLTNPAFDGAMGHIEHGWRLGFRRVILLLATSIPLHTADRFERLHKTGRLRRVFPSGASGCRACMTQRMSRRVAS